MVILLFSIIVYYDCILLYSNPLRTNLGDTLSLNCFNSSNLFIQVYTEQMNNPIIVIKMN